MSTPKRIQRKRTKGFKLPPNTVCVDRTSRWGNPFKVGVHAASNEMAVNLFRSWITSQNPKAQALLALAKKELRGKNLACFCSLTETCHADVWLEIANA